jgi:hypothetical protein
MFNRALSIILLLLATTCGFIYFQSWDDQLETDCRQQTPAQQLMGLIHHDFAQLKKENKLPKEWTSIAKVEFQMNSTLAKALLGKERPHFKLSPNGTHYLEVEIIDVPDEENPGLILQSSLFDLKTGNKVFEIGRTYNMSQLNKD